MKKQLLFIFTISMILAVFYGWHHLQAKSFITLNLKLSAATEINRPVLQVFFDTGEGYREDESQRFPVSPHENPHTILVTSRSRVLHGVRLDYLNGPGSVLLQDMRLISTSGDEILSISIPEDTVINQTSISYPSPGIVSLTSSPAANDPYIIIRFSEPFFSPAGQFSLSQLQFGMKIFITLFVGISLIFMFTGSWFGRKS